MAKYMTTDQHRAIELMRACKHPWKDLITVDDDQLLCLTCLEYLNPFQVRQARYNEASRLGEILRRANEALAYGDPEVHFTAYLDAMIAYKEFTAVHNEPLPI
jgi:hypothetical protein